MKNLIHAAVVTLLAASTAQAQQAVQWKVSDGGNGHWYLLSVTGPTTWQSAKASAENEGGHLATLTSDPEKRFVQALVASVPGFGESAARRWGPWLGGFQDRAAPDYSEPRNGWRWVTGEQWSYEAWPSYQPDNWCAESQVQEDYLSFAGYFLQADGAWNDLPSDGCDDDPVVSYVAEWSADCNGDGIFDYGQCRDGSLPDYNGNNIPDCCERGEACVTGNYPVQWKASEGGNGNWYRLWISEGYISWDAARLTAIAFGGHLATVGETSENSFISAISLFEAAWNNGGYIGPWLGGYQDRAATDYYEPANGWQWVTGEPWQFTSWDRFGNQPSNAGGHGAEDFLHFSSFSSNWNDLHCCNEGVRSAIIEWSADCNSDGLVDYGQILQSQLADANANGVPDTCESPTCADADLFPTGTVNGADLGALLSQWGEAPAGTASDLNRDGAVDGTDLGILLAFWGPCPN